MSMTNQKIQIVEAAKRGLTAAEIAENYGYEVETVAFILATDSEVRGAIEKDKNAKNRLAHQMDSLQDIALKTMKEIMLYGEKESARQSAAAYVIDYQCGLKAPKVSNTFVFNMDEMNERLKQVRERRAELESKIIEAEMVTQPS